MDRNLKNELLETENYAEHYLEKVKSSIRSRADAEDLMQHYSAIACANVRQSPEQFMRNNCVTREDATAALATYTFIFARMAASVAICCLIELEGT